MADCCFCFCFCLVVAEVKVVVAYVATGSPTDAAEQGHAGSPEQDLAVGTAGADAPHPLGQGTAPTTARGAMPTWKVLPATPKQMSLPALEDAAYRLAPEEALRLCLRMWLRLFQLREGHIEIFHQVQILFGGNATACGRGWRCPGRG